LDMYTLSVENAQWGIMTNGNNDGEEGLHLYGQPCCFFLHVPKGTQRFSVMLHSGDTPMETCRGTLTSPTGRTFEFDCFTQAADTKDVTVQNGEEGLWAVTVDKAPVHFYDDHFFFVKDGLLPVIFPDPEIMIQGE